MEPLRRRAGDLFIEINPEDARAPFGGFVDAGGTRCGVNVLTAEEPTDRGGGSAF